MSYSQHTVSPHSPSTSSLPTNHAQFFPTSYDPEHSHSAFQMNPLSQHPPRTPKPSLVQDADHYLPSSLDRSTAQKLHDYSGHEQGHSVKQVDINDDSTFSVDKRINVRSTDVWKEILAASAGRDKALKLIQYSLKLYLLIHKTLAGDMRTKLLKPRVLKPWEADLTKRITSSISGISLARKCLLLFNWLTPLTLIHQTDSIPYTKSLPETKTTVKPFLYPFLHAPPPVLLDLINGVAEDISTSAKLGLVKGKLGERAGRIADWTWFGGTLVALVELSMERALVRQMTHDVESRLYVETMQTTTGVAVNKVGQEVDESELKKLKLQLYWIRVTRMKLLMDLVFVSYDCFRLKKGGDAVKTVSGLASGILSSLKLYDRHQAVLLKALLAV